MRTLCIVFILAVTSRGAFAQATAGAATYDSTPTVQMPDLSSLPPAVRSCATNCVTIAMTCTSQPNASVSACQSRVMSCVQACMPADGGDATSSRTRSAPQVYDDPSVDTERLENQAAQTAAQLLAAWKQQDASRRTEAERIALQALQQIAQALCTSSGGVPHNGACTATGSARPPTLSSAQASSNKKNDERFGKLNPPGKYKPKKRYCAASNPNSIENAPKPGKFYRDDSFGLCMPGTSCMGSTSVTEKGLEFTLSSRSRPSSGMCLPTWGQKSVVFILRARNTTNEPKLLWVNSASVKWTSPEYGGLERNSLSSNTIPQQKLDPGEARDLEYTHDCLDGDPWGGAFNVNIQPYEPGTGSKLTVNVATAKCQDLSGPSITATQGVTTPTPNGVLIQIQ